MRVLEMIKRPVTLGEIQKMFLNIFLLKDLRDYILQDLLIHIQEEAAKIDEGLRKSAITEQINALPIFFCWLLSFCNMAEYDLEAIVWEKYQGICPYCGGVECFCKPKQKKPDTWFKNPQGKIPHTLNEWQESSGGCMAKATANSGQFRFGSTFMKNWESSVGSSELKIFPKAMRN